MPHGAVVAGGYALAVALLAAAGVAVAQFLRAPRSPARVTYAICTALGVVGAALLGSGITRVQSRPSFAAFVTSPGVGAAATALAAFVALVGVASTVRAQRRIAIDQEIVSRDAAKVAADRQWFAQSYAVYTDLAAPDITENDVEAALAALRHQRVTAPDDAAHTLVDTLIDRVGALCQPNDPRRPRLRGLIRQRGE